MFRLGYNTNGLAHHRVVDALRVCAALGYEAVALTPDAGLLDPYDLRPDEVADVRRTAEDMGLALSLETGSRFLLDPFQKHFPTLLEDDPAQRTRRIDFLERCIDLAADLGAEALSFWAGRAPSGRTGDTQEGDAEEGGAEREWERLCTGVRAVLVRGREQGVDVAFEPEPGMFLERPAGYANLLARLGSDGAGLGLCLDVGHCLVTGDLPVGAVVRAFSARLGLVHLDDIRAGVHDHRMFGQGDLDLPDVLNALLETGYSGIAAVELPRDAHRGPAAAKEALGHLRRALGAGC